MSHQEELAKYAEVLIEISANLMAISNEVELDVSKEVIPEVRPQPEPIFNENGIILRDGRMSLVTYENSIGQNLITLTESDVDTLSSLYDVPKAHIRAFLKVETQGSGFLSEPYPFRPKILFEAHWFYKLTPKPVSKTRPDLSSRIWDQSLYKGGAREWDRLKDAIAFDPIQAIKSCSWGIGQVMGFNYVEAGCKTLDQFVIEEFSGERKQLEHALGFIHSNNILDALRDGNWEIFAKVYNGPSYKANNYDIKLAAAAKE